MIKKHSDIIILLIIWAVSIVSIFIALTESYTIYIQNYIGYSLLVVASVLRILKVKRFKTILGGMLVLGTVNAIQFTYFTNIFVFTLIPFGHRFSSFGMQPLSIVLLIVLIALNFSAFMDLIHRSTTEDPQTLAERQKQMDEKYYNELKNEKDDVLHSIIANKAMNRREYIKAAQQIIEERKNKKK